MNTKQPTNFKVLQAGHTYRHKASKGIIKPMSDCNVPPLLFAQYEEIKEEQYRLADGDNSYNVKRQIEKATGITRD